jgi:hypothetical protein
MRPPRLVRRAIDTPSRPPETPETRGGPWSSPAHELMPEDGAWTVRRVFATSAPVSCLIMRPEALRRAMCLAAARRASINLHFAAPSSKVIYF